MAQLSDKIILYDDSCPMCKLYTKGFVHMDLLDPDKRVGFSCASEEILSQIDLDRGRHEIPLLDPHTGETVYGLDALFLILGAKWPILQPLFRWKFFRMLWYPFYQLITFNRRIIAGSSAPQTGFDCAPDFHLGYRLLYLVLAIGGAIGITVKGIQTSVMMGDQLSLIGLLTFLLLGISHLVFRSVGKNNWDNLGNSSSAMLMGAFILLPGIWFSETLSISVLIVSTILAILLMLSEWRRRFR